MEQICNVVKNGVVVLAEETLSACDHFVAFNVGGGEGCTVVDSQSGEEV